MIMGILTTIFLILVINQIYADENIKHYVNEWAATIPGGKEQAREIASQYGYTLVDEVIIIFSVAL